MSVFLAAFVAVGFGVTIERLDLTQRAREVVTRAGECLDALRDPALDDDAKERFLQRQALRLFALVGILTGGSLLALGLPLGVVWVLDRLGAASFGEVMAVLQRVDFLGATFAVGIVGFLLFRAARGS